MIKVLVAVDDSLVSLRAAREAARLFGNAEFLLINVARRPVAWASSWEYGATYPMEMSAMEMPDLPAVGLQEDEVSAVAVEAGLDPAEVLTVEDPDPAQKICDAAEEHDVDVIVVGSHDRGILDRLVSPSVSRAVLGASARPVLVVNERPPATAP